MRVGLLIQLLRFAHDASRERRPFEIDLPILEFQRCRGSGRFGTEEGPEDDVGCREREEGEDAERAFAGTGAGEGGPALPGSEDGAFVSMRVSQLDRDVLVRKLDLRALIDVVFRPESGGDVERVVIAPCSPPFFPTQDPRPA